MKLLSLIRILFPVCLVALITLSVASLAVPALVSPVAALSVQHLPTRPQPTSTPRPSLPTPTSPPPAPTAAPTPTATLLPPTPTATLTPTVTSLPPTPTATATATTTLQIPALQPTATVQSPTPTPTVLQPLPTLQVTATQGLPPDVILAQSVDLTFEELGYGTLGLSEEGSRGVYLDLPGNLVPDNDRSYLDLTIGHVPPEPDKPSVIKVKLNKAPLAVIPLSPENAEPTTYRFSLKSAPLTPGDNHLEISLDTGAGCNIRGAKVDAAVYSTSLFHLEYGLTQHQPDLARYPAPFFEPSFEYEPVYVVLPDTPSESDLSAAATLAAGLGKFSYGEIRLVSALDTQISTEVRNNHHLIVVGKEGSNRLLDQLDLPLRLDGPTLSEGQGVIQELVSPWNPLRMVLVITGRSDEGVLKASQALNREVHLFDMRGPVAIVEEVLPPESVASPQQNDDFTLADLGYEDKVIYGTRPDRLYYRFYMPLGWTMIEEPRFTLYFGHASIADPAYSSLTVDLDGVPIGSVLLDESNINEGMLEMSLPPWLVRPGRNTIHISIEMNLDTEDKCLFLNSEYLWTVVYSHSYFHLPFVLEDVEPSLALFPYPFNKRPGLSGLLLILPDQPGQLDYDLMLEVSAKLGAADRGDFLVIRATTSNLVSQQDRQEWDFILIGRPLVNSLIAELNDQLPQPFEPGTDRLRPQLESVVFAQDPTRDIGLIEELTAPWNAERTILVLTGTTDAGVALASATLLSDQADLAGNLSVIEESSGIHSFDTRPLASAPTDRVETPDSSQVLLSQLGERWW